MRVGRDRRLAIGGGGGQLDRVVLALAAERGAGELVATDHPLLIFVDNLSLMDRTGEPRRTEWVAGIPFSSGTSFAGRLSKLGGTLLLTNDSVVFKPLARMGRTRTWSLESLEAVSAFAERPPRLRLTSRDAEPLILMVLPRRATPVWSHDASARDDAVAAIAAAISEVA
jgi:hypothetical protein